MGFSVQQKAEYVGTFRWVAIQCMEMLASWVPSTPEMEIKVLFGRHVWDCAQHADAFGKRAFELRAPLNYTLPATAEYESLLADTSSLSGTVDRIMVLYDVICPGMVRRYRSYIDNTDLLMDEPSVRIIENAIQDLSRMETERKRLSAEAGLGISSIASQDWKVRNDSITNFVNHGSHDKRARGVRA